MLDSLIASAPRKTRFAGPVGEHAIAAAETALGIAFPADYRAFLAAYGCGNIGSIEILGLGIPETGVPSLLFVVRMLESDGFAVTPTVLPVSPIGDGSYSALVTGPLGDIPAGSIVIWDPSRESVQAGLDGVEAPSFGEWLTGRIACLRPR